MSSGDEAFCYTTTADTAPTTHNYGGSGLGGSYQQASNTEVLAVSAGDSIELWCYDTVGGSSSVFEGTIAATLINSATPSSKEGMKALPPR